MRNRFGRGQLDMRPLTKDRWDDFVELASRPGASILRHCWCTYYRKISSRGASAARNKQAMRSLVASGTVPGLIAYRDGRPVGWISVGPREEYRRLENSPIMKPVDDKPVWSIVCFFVDARERGNGVAEALLRGAIDYARSQGATRLEAYPVDKRERSNPLSMWFGAKSMYDRAGFQEVARRKATRPVVRRRVGRTRTAPAARGSDS
jgi:GNAT superfamily N-acetyltransferase